MAQLEIQATDVIKVILQFCKENNLMQTFEALQSECGVSLNTVDSLEQFVADVQKGRWEVILPQIQSLKLPAEVMWTLYEQIAMELIELKEIEAARAMLRQTQVFQTMKSEDPERCVRLERLTKEAYADLRDLYGIGMTKDKRRAQLAQSLSQEVVVVPPQRLMSLVGQALKWQQLQGMLPPGAAFDLFRGTAQSKKDEQEMFPRDLDRTIKVGSKKSHPEVARFSPDGQALATGSVDGFIEVWDYMTGKLKTDLQYQAEEMFMMHDTPVLALAWSRDSELLASGSQDGQVKVWRVKTGQCLKKFEHAHTEGVTSLAFSRDSTQVLSSSFDGTARVHGLKSGRLLKEMRGHGSYVNGAVWSADGGNVYTASSDGTVRVWDAKTCKCMHTFAPPASAGTEPTVNDVHLLTATSVAGAEMLVSTRSPEAFLMNAQGQVVKTLASGKRQGGDFLCSLVTPRGKYIYCLGEDSTIYCFSSETGKLEHIISTHESGAIGMTLHPHRNMIATWGEDGTVRTWVA